MLRFIVGSIVIISIECQNYSTYVLSVGPLEASRARLCGFIQSKRTGLELK